MRKFSKLFENEISSQMGNQYDDVIAEIKEMIQKSEPENFTSWIEGYIQDPEDKEIEGLIDDSDIFDFYLKYRSQIDDILSDTNFFQEIPEENNVFSLYDFIIKGTMQAVSEFVKMMEGGQAEPDMEAEF